MKLKKHVQTKIAIITISLAFLGGATVGQNTQTVQEKAFNKQVTLLENENKRIFSNTNDVKILPSNYQTQEFDRVDDFIQKHNLSHRQTFILKSIVNSNTNDYLDVWNISHYKGGTK